MAKRQGAPIGAVAASLLVLGVALPIFLLTSGDDDSGTGGVERPREVVESVDSDGDDGPGALGVAGILGFIALSFVASGFLARFLIRKTSRADVLEGGTPATATIVSMTETGTTVNDSPMVEFELRVQRDGTAPYDVTMKQVLPRLLLARVQPGLVVPVKVMPTDPNEVAIDFGAVAESGIGSPTLSASALVHAPVHGTVDTDEFLVRAIPADAEIDEMAQADRSATNPRSGEVFEVFTFVLTVHRDGHAPYTANLLQGVPAEYVGTIGPGGHVPIGINPDNPADVAINWRELERQRRTGRS